MNINNRYEWASSKLQNGRLLFDTTDGFRRAVKDGFFFIKAPDTLNLSSGDLFATNFYLPKTGNSYDAYRDFKSWTTEKLAEREGYFLRNADQVEQFFLEHRFWKNVFPLSLVTQATQMKEFGLEVLRAILSQLDIPAKLWNKATGGCLSGLGTYHLTFNHFRPTVRSRGLNIHKDSGWVTILRSLEPGLEILRKGEWLPIIPRPDTFIVNFGCAMEILTRYATIPVAAVAHRVVEQKPGEQSGVDRFSYALFIDSSLDKNVSKGLYSYKHDKGLVLETSFEEFLNKILHNTYEQHTQGLY
ncbi:hypothetical protein BB987_20695 [Photorhabdus temperata]|uniref:Dioxygenase, isopenicillin N synthase n=1 Tax=Photorhabdus khanii NC19 TaxID=1004151 RepID=W3V7K5_9GAMM|nr:2OG-Fe(II) oxygenase family protein [Photorhabdus khanii]ETS31926.1 dioxygenase, isopenicillin N synthase [Photorhabdus khanii NC19]OHV58757.1 hypothetical protein BB987_20695 [Photorhabdus temperata]